MRTGYRIIFWIAVFLILLIAFGKSAGNYIHSFYFISFFLPVVIATSWVFNEIVVNRFLLEKKYFRFFQYTLYLLIISMNLEMIIVFISFTLMSYYEYDNMSSILTDFRLMPLIMYLLVVVSAFISVISKLITEREKKAITENDKNTYIEVRSERKNRRVLLDSILYIESMADYVRIFTLDAERIITRERIGYFERFLPEKFLRIHRSYIVNINHIKSYSKEEISFSDVSLPVSRTYKDKVIEKLNIR